MFVELTEIFWMSKIPYSAGTEKNESECFGKNVNFKCFKYSQSLDEFNMDLTFFQRKRHADDTVDNVTGKNNLFHRLNVMDAGRSNETFG